MSTEFSNEQRGKDAELRAHQLANSAELRPSALVNDVHGFDVYMQVPLEPRHEAPIQFLAASTPVLVQVKGTTRDRFDIDLRVWEKLIEAPIPVFFLVYEYPDKQTLDPTRVFLVHLGRSLIDAVAERLWRASVAGTVASGTMSLSWSDADELAPAVPATLLARLRSCIGDAGTYVREKLAARERAGQGERPFELRVRREAGLDDDIEREMAEFAVGIRSELPADRIDQFETRFELQSTDPMRTFEHPVIAWPDDEPPSEPCTIVLIARATGEEVTLAARLAVSSRIFPWLRKEHVLVRVFHEVVDFVLRPSDRGVTFSLHPPGECARLQQLDLASRMWRMLRTGECDLELRLDGVPRYRTSFVRRLDDATLPPDQEDVLEAARIAWALARRVGLPDDVRLSQGDLLRSIGVLRRVDAVQSETISGRRFSAKLPEAAVGSCLAVLVPTWIRLGDDVIAVHGLLFGRATRGEDDDVVRVESAASRILVARRIVCDAIPSSDGGLGEAIQKIEADPMIEGILGVEGAEQSWEQLRQRILEDARDSSKQLTNR